MDAESAKCRSDNPGAKILTKGWNFFARKSKMMKEVKTYPEK